MRRLLLVGLTVAAGCGTTQHAEPTPVEVLTMVEPEPREPVASAVTTSTPPPRPAATPAPAVKVTATGATPRRPFRYHFVAGQTDEIVVEIGQRATLIVGAFAPSEVRPPLTRAVLSSRVTSLDAYSNAIIETKVTALEAVPTSDASTDIVTALNAELVGLVKTTFIAVVAPSGAHKRFAVDAPTALTPQQTVTLDGLRAIVAQLPLPLPDEPLGRGARWTVQTNLPATLVAIDQTNDARLVDADARGTHVALAIKQATTDTALTLATLPPGSKVTLTTFEGAGTGKLDIDEEKPWPTGDWKIVTHVTGTASGGKDKDPAREIKLDAQVDVRLRKKR